MEIYNAYIDSQAIHKSPQLIKGNMQNSQQLQAKNSQKTDVNHFVKKNSGLPPSQLKGTNMNLQQLNAQESTQSFKASPVKSDTGLSKNYPQSIKKVSTHKAQNMHKKAVSLMGGSHTSHQSHLGVDFDFSKGSQQISMLNSQKQSYAPSQQNSFNDYSSNNAHYGDRMLPKVDNFIVNEKTGSLLTAQQQLQIKNYQKILQESQLSQTGENLGGTQIGSRFGVNGNSIDINHINNITGAGGFKSFDQRPPGNQLQNNQSQRVSIMSTTVAVDQSQTHSQQLQNPAYRSHTNSFKSNNNITMKYPPNKYVKGGPVVTAGQTALHPQSGIKSKKTLQYHHQRTFSDNPNFTGSRGQLFNASGNQTGQNTNRNFQELIRGVHEKEYNENGFINSVGISNTETHHNYPIQSVTSSINMPTQQIMYNAKTTIGSSRQSAQSQGNIDERDALFQLMKNTNQEKYTDMKQIYNGQATIKDQIQKTKQQLKLTQSQFGGPSRKVVQNKFNVNTQSYRASNQNSLNGQTSTKVSIVNETKSTPKIYLNKSKKGYKNSSQNTSSHGVRTTSNVTQLHNVQILLNDGLSKRKDSHKFEGSSSSVIVNNININLSGSVQDALGKQIPKSHEEMIAAGHKRSASDGNSIFQSLSNRAHMHLDNNFSNANNNHVYKQNNKTSNNMNVSQQQTDALKQQYQKQQQLSKGLSSGPYNQQSAPKLNSNEYQIQSERQQVYPKPSQQSNQNVIINSHRQVVVSDPKKYGLHSHQLSIDQDQHIQSQQFFIQPQQQQQVPVQQKKVIPKRDVEMVIEDQDFSHLKQQQESQMKSATNKIDKPLINIDKSKPNSNYATLKPVEERIETQESAMSDPNLSPRTRKNVKLGKKIRLAFQKTNNPPATTSDFYKIGKVMGKGAFGKVNLAIHRLSNKFVALKSINKQFLSEEASKRKVMQEFNILRRTRHRNIVRLYESFETQQHIVFVMEVCGSGDLLTYVRRRRKLKEDIAKHMFKQIMDGLRYCHSRGILHRDIKLDNILLTSEGDIKICDFGVSKLVKPGEIMTEQCGTPAYIAPEIFENKGYEGYASDVWSAGVVLYAMLYGTVPFKASNMSELQKQIIKVQTTFKDEISSEAISLLKSILERDPQKRLSISEILRHPWMKDVPEKVTIFTDQEKEKVDQDFAYYNFKNEGNPGEVVHTDPFTEQMLNSTQNSLIKNVSTKSVILAPFNSTKSHIDDNYYQRRSIQDMLVDKKFIKFAAKVKEIDRQYEANNNAELDNGVYHQDSEEEKKEEEEKKKAAEQNKKSKYNSLKNSFDKDKNDEEQEDGELQKEIEEEQKKKNQSEWQKLEQMVIDKQKIEDDEDIDKILNANTGKMGSAMTMVIDEKIISEIEKYGFPKLYLVSSLNNDDLNYSTTFYHLLTTQKEY